jgi:hypothetical protein
MVPPFAQVAGVEGAALDVQVMSVESGAAVPGGAGVAAGVVPDQPGVAGDVGHAAPPARTGRSTGDGSQRSHSVRSGRASRRR